MEKRALYVFDNKRILLADGIHTLAIGHKDVTGQVVEDRIINPHADEVIPEKKAREMGLLWSKRRGAMKRAGIDLPISREENEDLAVAAGQASRNRIRQMVDQVPDFPDRYNPLDARPPKHHTKTLQFNDSETHPKRQRVTSLCDSEEEAVQSSTSQNLSKQAPTLILFHRGIARIESEASEDEALFASPTPSLSHQRRRNSYVNDQAEERDSSSPDSDSEETSPIAQPYHSSGFASDYDADSSDSDLDFVVGDDCFD